MEFLKRIKQSSIKTKELFIMKLEGLSFIKKAAEKKHKSARIIVYAYLWIVIFAVGICLSGYIAYVIFNWHISGEKMYSEFIPVIFNIGKILITAVIIFLFGSLPASNIHNLLTGRENYVDWITKSSRRTFEKRFTHKSNS